MSFITIYTAKDTFDANLVKSKLEEAGIKSFIENETISSVIPNYTGMMGLYINLKVNNADKDFALEVLEINTKKQKCTNCGSEDIEFTFGENKIKKYLAIFISMLVATPMGNLTRDYYCRDCGFKTK